LDSFPRGLPPPRANVACTQPAQAPTPPHGIPQLNCDGTGLAAPGALVLLAGQQLDINQASAQDFSALPGVGDRVAERVVAWRRDHGPFSSVEGLRAVRGVGPKTVARLGPMLKVAPPPHP
jgi:competence protein ComEA